jgi:serine/threonine protein kinase
MAGGLLVADVYDSDAFVQAAVVDGLNMPPAKGKEVRTTVALQRSGDEAPSVDHTHGDVSQMRASLSNFWLETRTASTIALEVTSASLRIDAGVRLGPYLVERRLGQSRSGNLYVARDASGALAVLRLLHPDSANAGARARLRREARALSGVDHPGVVRVCGVGEQDGILWIATNYVRGTDIARLLDERGPLSIDVALRHAIQAAEALVAAHDAGATHRDLKPSNMVLTLDERVVLVDFGIGPRGEADDLTTGVRNPLAGVTAYSAPEQIEHGLADERSDVWALGCVLYEMVVGAPPFGNAGHATATAILRDEPVFPAVVPPPIVHTVNACLRKNSFARIATSRELLALLRDAVEGSQSTSLHSGERISSYPSGRHAFPVSGIIPPPPRLPSVWLSTSRSSDATPTHPPSSRTRVAAVRGRVKGAAVRAGIAWFAETYGQSALARVVELASPELRAILRPKDPVFGLITSGWYETQRIGELIELIERVASPLDPANFGSAVGEAIARDNVGGVHRALFRLVATPSLLEANAQRVWRTYIDEGTFSVRLRGRASFDAKARGWSRHHPSVCRILRAMLESSLRAVGYTSLVLARRQCVGLGDPHCVFSGTWTVE